MAHPRLNRKLKHLKAPSAVLPVAIWGAIFLMGIFAVPHAFGARHYGPHSGYLETTKGERDTQVEDMILVQPPESLGPTLRERIFNDKLSKEFRDRYEEKFGRTEVERIYHSPNRYTYYDDVYGFDGSVQDMNDERRRFGEFMIRRLAEYHVDSYAKSDPSVRPLWEAKERLSQVKLEVSRFRFDVKYSISGNTLDVNAVNPWLSTSRVRLHMNSGAFGPGPVEETIVSLGRNLTNTVVLEGHAYLTDGIFSVLARKSLSERLATTATFSTFFKDQGTSIRESLYLSGLSYTF